MDEVTDEKCFEVTEVFNAWLVQSFHSKKEIIRQVSRRELPGEGWFHALCALKEMRSRAVRLTLDNAAQVSNKHLLSTTTAASESAFARNKNLFSFASQSADFKKIYAEERLWEVTHQLLLQPSFGEFVGLVIDLLETHGAIWTQASYRNGVLVNLGKDTNEHVIFLLDWNKAIHIANPRTGEFLGPMNVLRGMHDLSKVLHYHSALAIVAQ